MYDFKQVPSVNKEGETVYVDYVQYGPAGEFNSTVIEEKVARLKPREEDAIEREERFYAMKAKWDVIAPAYEAWKSGNTVPEGGTPLSAWSGLTPDAVKVLKMAGVKSVEELSELSDSVLTSIRLPDMRNLRKQAGLFLQSKDQSVVVEQIKQRDAQIEVMEQQIRELMALVSEATEPSKKDKAGKPQEVQAEG